LKGFPPSLGSCAGSDDEPGRVGGGVTMPEPTVLKVWVAESPTLIFEASDSDNPSTFVCGVVAGLFACVDSCEGKTFGGMTVSGADATTPGAPIKLPERVSG
jgi:hypothetical protein